MSDGITGQGSYISIGDGASPEVFTEVGEVVEIPGPISNVDEIDFTHLRSPAGYREFKPSFKDNDDLAISMNYLPADTTNTSGRAAQQTLLTNYANSEVFNCKVTWPDGSYTTFEAYVKQKGRAATVSDPMRQLIVLRVTGQVVDHEAA